MYFAIIKPIKGWIIFFKKVKIIDFFNDNSKLNLPKEIPKDKSTQGKARSDILFKYKTDDNALLGLSACFGNSVALGIPLMHSLLGKSNVMPYMILVLFHGLVHFTYTTIIIESYRNRSRDLNKKILSTITGLFKNIVLVGIFVGIFLNYTKIMQPNILMNILNYIYIVYLKYEKF